MSEFTMRLRSAFGRDGVSSKQILPTAYGVKMMGACAMPDATGVIWFACWR